MSCLSGGGDGRGHNERRLGAGDGDGVAVGGGGAKPSPASGVREEHELYYLLCSKYKDCQLAKCASHLFPLCPICRSGDDIFKFEKICMLENDCFLNEICCNERNMSDNRQQTLLQTVELGLVVIIHLFQCHYFLYKVAGLWPHLTN